MRSSVSYILSSSTSEPNMSHPDYEQYSHDHAALLVLVRHIGNQLKPKLFMKFHDRISKINSVRITDSTGVVRNILIRYIKEHPVENNDWGDFQTHRRLLGLISLGKYDSQQELNEICRVHESLKVKYNNTLFDSRSILFGPTKESESPVDDNPSSGSSGDSPNNTYSVVEKFTTPSNFKTRALFYDVLSPCVDLELQLNEFINSLFWVLESKRLERSREKLERVSLLLAPFEKKDFVGLDMESRNNKKRCTGRMTKHLGDLSMQAGLLCESLAYYSQAAEILKSVNDWLWLGAAYEGLSAASALVLYPDMQRNIPLHRNASLQEGSPRKSSQTPPATGLVIKKMVANVLTPEEMSKRYREAIIHYSKYQNAGIIETEASFKAARIAVEQNHALQAASFLQNVVYINLTLSEQEKIQRFETLADLYTQIGFVRKAAFCLRLAATRYVSPQNPAPNWGRCYTLMLQSLSGHHLTLDPVEMRETGQGWPALQIQLIQELVVAARRTGHSALATRHMTFLLQTMWQHLSHTEQKELAMQLQSLSAQCEGSPVLLVLDSGLVMPPANLTDIPVCESFTLKDLQPHLRPRCIESVKQEMGPFLFTPIHFGGGSLDRRSKKTDPKMDFLWVKNEVCEVQLKLTNPLPFELKVSNMRLLTAGVVFESIPETVVLPPDIPTSLTLSGWARENGELELSGYSTHALGVKSNCRLRHMRSSTAFPPQYKVEVVPVLPLLEVSTSLPQSASFSNFHDDCTVTSASTAIYHGETAQCTITLKNVGKVPIEFLEVEMSSVLEPCVQEQIFSWDKEEVKNLLPIEPGQEAPLILQLYSIANFLAPNMGNSPAFPQDTSSGLFSSMSASVPGGSLPSRINSSFRSSNSGQSSLAGGLTTLFQQQPSTSVVEGHLKLRYSGADGVAADYCRSCSIFFMLEMIPSLHVTNWDVLPAEVNTQFYLVLDITNLTDQEMELHYAPSKTMLIEGRDGCRVPVPVDRCPLAKLTEPDGGAVASAAGPPGAVCSEHVARSVDLGWHLPGTGARGVAPLDGIGLTARMLDVVRMSPLDWEVSLNGEMVKAQEEVSCEAGDCLALKMSIANSLEKTLRQLTLSVQFYQDYENGTLNYRMDTRLAVAGSTNKYFAGGVCHCSARLDGQVIVITGANSGIGRALALQLAKRGATLVLACRDTKEGLNAKTYIITQLKDKDTKIIIKYLDLCSISSVIKFSENLIQEFDEIYALVNNAAVFYHPQKLTEDGYEVTLQTNYLSHFILTHHLLVLLRKSIHARILNVVSEAHRQVNVYDIKAVTKCHTEFRDHFTSYGVSKLALILFTKELSKKLRNTNIIVNAVNPGNVETPIFKNFPLLSNPWLYALQWPLRLIVVKSPQQGAQTLLHALLTTNRSTGQYYSDCKLALPSPLAANDKIASEYYQLTLEVLADKFNTESDC